MPGKLVVFEGIDGSGKSTQFKLICDRLSEEDYEFRRIVFPRYEQPSSALIRMYLGGEFGAEPGAVNAYAASSFYAVDRYASFMIEWKDYYESGGLILTDRYTTSNALHQGAKIPEGGRKEFFKWLYGYEFDCLGLPKPDLVFYMNIDVSLAAERLSSRQISTDTHADIHELDTKYLESCAQSGAEAAVQFKWCVIDCAQENNARSMEDIHSEVFSKLQCFIQNKKTSLEVYKTPRSQCLTNTKS